jgi:hypothetical protein
MSGLFKPKMPKIEPPPPPPETDVAKQREIESTRMRRRRGRASTMMSTPETRTQGGVGTTRLLGGGM